MSEALIYDFTIAISFASIMALASWRFFKSLLLV